MDRALYDWCDVEGGVRQGGCHCPLAVQDLHELCGLEGNAQMPEGCGMQLAYQADEKLQLNGCGTGGSLELVSLWCADYRVLLSPSRGNLTVMVQVIHKIAHYCKQDRDRVH
jgi:hypothetical protein